MESDPLRAHVIGDPEFIAKARGLRARLPLTEEARALFLCIVGERKP
jgi:hypothetical protein